MRWPVYTAAAVAAGALALAPAVAHAATPYPVDQVGIIVPYTGNGPYSPTSDTAVTATTDNGGCSWITQGTVAGTGNVSGVVYSFITRSFGTEYSTDGGHTFQFEGANHVILCGQ
jgi:hypothetical protein